MNTPNRNPEKVMVGFEGANQKNGFSNSLNNGVDSDKVSCHLRQLRSPSKLALPEGISGKEATAKIRAAIPITLSSFADMWDNIRKLVMKDLINLPEDMIRITAGMLNFIYKLVKAVNMGDYMSLALDMILSTPKGFFKNISLAEQTEYVKNTVSTFFKGCSQTVESEGLCSSVRTFLKLGIENINLVQSSDVLTGLRDLILRLMSFSLLPITVTEIFIKTLGKPKSGNILDTLEGIMGSLVTLFTFGESISSENGVYKSLMQSKGVKGYAQTAEILCIRAKHTYVNTPIDNHENVKQWFKEVSDHLNLGRTLQKNLSVKSPENLKLVASISSLVDMLIVKKKEMQNKRRHVPFLATIISDPGVGKSVIKLAFVKMCFEDAGVEYSSDLVYVKNLIDEYYSGIHPKHMVCELAELGSTHRDIVKSKGDPILSVLTTMVDDAPMPLNMANLADKDNTFFDINYIIVDANLSLMNADVATNHPSAIMRRVVETRPTVKHKYRLPGVGQIDRVKARTAPHPLEVYTFSVVTYIVINNKECTEKFLLTDGSCHEWYAVMKKLLREHREANEYGDKMSEMGLDYLHSHLSSSTVTVTDVDDIVICQTEGDSEDSSLWSQDKKDFWKQRNRSIPPSELIPSLSTDEMVAALAKDIEDELEQTQSCDIKHWGIIPVGGVVDAVFTSPVIKDFMRISLRIMLFFAWFCLLSNRESRNVIEVAIYHIIYSQFGNFTQDRIYLMRALFSIDQYEYGDRPQKVLFKLFIKCIVTHWVIKFICEYFYYTLYDGAILEYTAFALSFYTVVSWLLVYYYSQCESFTSFLTRKIKNYLWCCLIRTGDEIIDSRTQQLLYYYGVFSRSVVTEFFTFFVIKILNFIVKCTGSTWISGIAFYLIVSNRLRKEWLTGVRPFLARAPPTLVTIAGSFIIVAATLSLARKIRQATAEGLAVSRERTHEEIEAKMEDIHIKSGCKIPAPRKRQGNTPDWDANQYMTCVVSNSLKMSNNIEDVEKAITRNLRHVRCTNGVEDANGKTEFLLGKGIGIYGSYFLTNKHSLMNLGPCGYLRFEIVRNLNDRCSKVICNVAPNAMSIVSDDLVIIKLRGCNFADIRGYIPDNLLKIVPNGVTALIGGTSTHAYTYGKLKGHNNYHGKITFRNTVSYKWSDHKKGLCGTPLITNHGSKSVLAGIHCASNGSRPIDDCYADMFSMNEIKAAVKKISSSLIGVYSEGAVRLSSTCGGFEPIDKHNPALFESMDGAVLVGQMQGYRHIKPKTSAVVFRKTAEQKVCDITDTSSRDDEGNLLYGPPPMRAVRTPEGDLAAPMNHFAAAIGKVKPSLNPVILEEVVKLRTEHIVKELKKKGITKLEPVPIEVAVNGSDEDCYINAMKPNTSGGVLWPGKKSNHMSPTELPFRKEGAMKLDDEVVAQVHEVLEAYEVEEKANPLIGAQLKDEARSKKKNDVGKTRVFCMSSMEMTIVQRMFLISYYSLMIMINFSFETGLGINMHSTDVDAIVNHLEALEPGVDMNVLEGDYSAFDTTMLHDISCAANTVTFNVLSALGYSIYALKMVMGIFSDDILPAIILNGLLLLACMTPSGAYPTAEKNCEKNVIMVMYAWVYLCTYGHIPFKPRDFWDHVRLVTYGDDLLGSVTSSAAPYFNNVIYAEFCLKHFGMKYTSATKGQVLKPFVEKKDMTFLKRGFVWREDLDHWVAPLDRSSIMKSLLWSLPSKVVSSHTQFTECCVSANRELFFHYKEKEFFVKREKLITLVVDETSQSRDRVSALFLTYSQLKDSLYPNITDE
jgi:hypothetical protein